MGSDHPSGSSRRRLPNAEGQQPASDTLYRLKLARAVTDQTYGFGTTLFAASCTPRLPLSFDEWLEVPEPRLLALYGMLPVSAGTRRIMEADLAGADWIEVERRRETGEWEPLSRWRQAELRRAADLAAVMSAKRKGGRPRSNVNGLCLAAHRMRVHEGQDNEDVARVLYADLYHRSRPEALKHASDAASKGRPYCPDCGINPRS